MADLVEAQGKLFYPPGPDAGLIDLGRLAEMDPWTLAKMERLGMRLGESILAASAAEMEAGSDAPQANRLTTISGHRSVIKIWAEERQGLVGVTRKALDADVAGVARIPYKEGARGFVWLGEPVAVDWRIPVASAPIAKHLRTVASWVRQALSDGQTVPIGYGKDSSI